MACANFRWCLAQALVLRRDPILPPLKMYLDNVDTSL